MAPCAVSLPTHTPGNDNHPRQKDLHDDAGNEQP